MQVGSLQHSHPGQPCWLPTQSRGWSLPLVRCGAQLVHLHRHRELGVRPLLHKAARSSPHNGGLARQFSRSGPAIAVDCTSSRRQSLQATHWREALAVSGRCRHQKAKPTSEITQTHHHRPWDHHREQTRNRWSCWKRQRTWLMVAGFFHRWSPCAALFTREHGHVFNLDKMGLRQ